MSPAADTEPEGYRIPLRTSLTRPILMGGECVGGIGVAGGSWEHDQNLAREAVEAIGAKAA